MNKCTVRDKKTAVYLRNQQEEPASYYRISQYTREIKNNIIVHDVSPLWVYRANLNLNKNSFFEKNLKHAFFYFIMLSRVTFFLIKDIFSGVNQIVILRQILPRYSPFYIRILLKLLFKRKTIIWDFDDNIFVNGDMDQKEAEFLFQRSDKIIVTNHYLKSCIEEKWWDKVILLPTTDGDLKDISLHTVNEKRKKTFENEIRLVWVGTSGNLVHLEKTVHALDKTAEKLLKQTNKKLQLVVVCNKPLKKEATSLKIINRKWSKQDAISAICNAHIGIMPLEENDFTIGKGGFKLIQYQAAGLPVIASPVGINQEIVTENCGFLVYHIKKVDEWNHAILKLSLDWQKWESYSFSAQEKWNSDFSYQKNLEFWKKILEN